MDWIQGDKFKGMADFTFAPTKHISEGINHWVNIGSESFRIGRTIIRPGSRFKSAKKQIPKYALANCTLYRTGNDDYDNLQNTFYPEDLILQELEILPIIYTHTIYVKDFFELMQQYPSLDFVLISHNADTNIDFTFIVPKNCKKWFTTNVNIVNSKIESIPIGLENNRWFIKERKKEKMENLVKQPKEMINWLYVNINVKTNPEKRAFAYEMFKDKKWATCHYGSNGSNFDQYLFNITNHPFVLCPEGNGIDTHRFWETLYMGSIPVVKRNINNSFYEGLAPIVYVSDWQEVTLDLLKNKKELFDNNSQVNSEFLIFTYWKDKILKATEL